MASFDLHSRRRSLSSVTRVMPVGALIVRSPLVRFPRGASGPACGRQSTGFHRIELIGSALEQEAWVRDDKDGLCLSHARRAVT